jgi:hypothetical protein
VRRILIAPGAKRSSWRWMHLEQQHSGVVNPVWGQVGKSEDPGTTPIER